MFKAKTGRRFLALLLAILCMVTTTAPSFAMGFDDLQTVIDMTTGGENGDDDFYEFPETSIPDQKEDTPPPVKIHPWKKPLRRKIPCRQRMPNRRTPKLPHRRSLAMPRWKERKDQTL